jgi:hypothetical protein
MKFVSWCSSPYVRKTDRYGEGKGRIFAVFVENAPETTETYYSDVYIYIRVTVIQIHLHLCGWNIW